MATLEKQYKNYLKENPDSKFTFDEWKSNIFVPKLCEGFSMSDDLSDWDVTLNDGLEDDTKPQEESYPLNFIRYLTGFSKPYIREKYDKWYNKFRDDETKTNKNTGIH